MKKIVSMLLILSMLFTAFPASIFASEHPSNAEYTYFEDGSYLVTVVEDTSDVSTCALSTKSGSKTTRFYNADDEVMWYIKVYGTFNYGDDFAICTSVDMEAESNVSVWEISDRRTHRSGNIAAAFCTAKQYFTFAVVKTMEESVTLMCSPIGVLS